MLLYFVPNYAVVLLIVLCIAISFITKKLSLPASVAGGMVALGIFLGAGYNGLLMLGGFFILATAATSWKIDKKEKLGLSEENKGNRKTSQVVANGGLAALIGVLAAFNIISTNHAELLIASCLSSATADTLSSELGSLYGKAFYNVVTFKKDQRGLNGVISLEGTCIGVAGSTIISILYALGHTWSIYLVFIIIAGTIGNLFDSFLGATVERKGLLSNDVVNFLNTGMAASIAVFLNYIYHQF